MNELIGISTFVGGMVLLAGLATAAWSGWLWLKPDSLAPHSALYRYLCIDWQVGPRKRKGDPTKLTDRQVRYYAIRGMIASILLIIVGIIMVLRRRLSL